MKFEDYNILSKSQKLEIVANSDNQELIHYAFYDEDMDIKLAVCQNEQLPLGKLKRYTNDRDEYLRQKAIEVYERRLVY